MTVLEALAILAAGAWAGTINTVVGSGTLVTFPVLLALGYAPLTANVSNNIGLVAGGLSGTFGYRRELRGQGRRVRRFAVASLTGAVVGSVALLALGDGAFEAIVPGFIALALVAVVLQPRLAAWLERRGRHREHGGAAAFGGVFATGIYGGYFGAAQGVMLMAVLGLSVDDELQRINGLKNVLATLVNAVSAVVFVVAADVDWGVVALIAAGSVAGGQLGARYGRRLSARALRGVIVAVGVAAMAQLIL